MSVSSLSSAGLDPRRRRILFRCRRRGIREMDIALGNFAETHLQALTEEQLGEFERWLDAADPDLLSWITGEVALPAEYDTPLFQKLMMAPREAIAAERPIS
jgi:antitoxin CptB